MKKLITFLLFAAMPAFAQDLPQLKLTAQGVEPVVVNVEGKNAHDIYLKTLNWVQEAYKNPDKVLKANIADEKIRVEGFKQSAWFIKGLMKVYMDMDYTLEIEFKEGKYRFTYIIGGFKGSQGQNVSYSYEVFWKKDGSLRGMYDEAPKMIEAEMNSLNLSLYSYLTGEGKKKSDW
ncbi:MAG: DUF4468 domain-containing protein [Flavobacterium sp.]|uniref:DUF4468 domain-containing protein n=1 Tax=Flavobacterium sp. TaxID=239 RepID=UPI00122925FA|nr:DUF4468 domain-containing protein [Flavobacterium sp.]RZJ67671.1 MAG: DUF4468 domain-containing protein [Flavobacterium sp.]